MGSATVVLYLAGQLRSADVVVDPPTFKSPRTSARPT